MTSGSFKLIIRFIFASSIASIAAAAAGLAVVLLLFFPVAPLMLLVPGFLIESFWQGLKFSLPVTFAVLPLAAFFLRSVTHKRRLLIALAGAIGGAATMAAWSLFGEVSLLLVVPGTIAGLSAGLAYGRFGSFFG
jgi:hypothetical protein